MKSKILKLIDVLYSVYVWVCVIFVTAVIWGFMLFGGDIKININTPWQ